MPNALAHERWNAAANGKDGSWHAMAGSSRMRRRKPVEMDRANRLQSKFAIVFHAAQAVSELSTSPH